MKTRIQQNLLWVAILILLSSLLALAQHKESTKNTSIYGLVRDIACPIQNTKASAKNFSLDCALQCARTGSPLVIQTKGNLFYFPISDNMPDTDQRSRLMPFVGKFVKASGQVFERNGTRAIIINNIQIINQK